MLQYPKPTGIISMIRPDGTEPTPAGYTGGGRSTCRGDSISMATMMFGLATFAAAGRADGRKRHQGHPAGTKTGDVIHVFQGGSIQMITDTSIDAAGDVWAANNWNYPQEPLKRTPLAQRQLGPGVRALRSFMEWQPR